MLIAFNWMSLRISKIICTEKFPEFDLMLSQTVTAITLTTKTFLSAMKPLVKANLGIIFCRRALEARTNRANAAKQLRNKLGSPETTKVALICTLYYTALHTLTQLRLDILTGTRTTVELKSNNLKKYD